MHARERVERRTVLELAARAGAVGDVQRAHDHADHLAPRPQRADREQHAPPLARRHVEVHLEITVASVLEHLRERSAELRHAVLGDRREELRERLRGAGVAHATRHLRLLGAARLALRVGGRRQHASLPATEDLERVRVVVDHLARHVELHQTHRHRVRQPPQQLLALLQRLLRRHLRGDVDQLDEHVAGLRPVEQVVKRRVDPQPAPVLVLAPAAVVLVALGREHLQPALDGARLVVGVDLVEHRATDHVLAREAAHLRERLVAVEHVRVFVLGERAQARGGRARRLGGLRVLLLASSSSGSTMPR